MRFKIKLIAIATLFAACIIGAVTSNQPSAAIFAFGAVALCVVAFSVIVESLTL